MNSKRVKAVYEYSSLGPHLELPRQSVKQHQWGGFPGSQRDSWSCLDTIYDIRNE